jgi:uncharacterized Zn finger protein (UPF0148 family)
MAYPDYCDHCDECGTALYDDEYVFCAFCAAVIEAELDLREWSDEDGTARCHRLAAVTVTR